MFPRKTFVLLVASVAAMLVSTAVGAQTTLERIKREGIVKIGFSNQSPYSFKQPDGSLAGIDYEAAAALFKRLGVNRIEGVAVKFGSLIPGIKAQHFDVIVAGLFIRPARCKEIAFSEPNIRVSDTFVVKKGNPLKLHSYDDVIKNPAIKIAAIQGGTQVKDAVRAGVPEDRVLVFPDFSELLFAVKSGRIGAVAISAIGASEMVAADDGKTLERALPFKVPVFDGKPAVNYAGFGFRDDDKDLVAAFNGAWKSFKRSPEHLAILAKYGLTENEIPPDTVAIADLCKE